MFEKTQNPKARSCARKGLYFLLIFSIGTLSLQCTSSPISGPTQPFKLTAAEKSLIESDNEFGLKLFKKINETAGDKNIFISPLSISMALGMTLNGADGATQEAMRQTLELSGLTMEEINESYRQLIDLLTQLDPKVQFQIANSIWYRDDFQQPETEFLDRCDEYFNALVTELNFSDPNAPAIINDWVDENTNGKIKEIIKIISADDVMFLINAIYFKGCWTYQFDEDLTQDDLFILPDGSETTCQMMAHKALHKYFVNDRFQAVDLSYGDEAFSMTIFLPNRENGLEALIATLEPDSLEHWLSHFSNRSVDIYLPRFKLHYDLTLNDALTALGMGIAFSSEAANFSKMYQDVRIWIDRVKHKTFVEVNEEGTEAAAVTSVHMAGTTSGDPQDPLFQANRPFLFMIRENYSQTILFIGKIVDPTQGG